MIESICNERVLQFGRSYRVVRTFPCRKWGVCCSAIIMYRLDEFVVEKAIEPPAEPLLLSASTFARDAVLHEA